MHRPLRCIPIMKMRGEAMGKHWKFTVQLKVKVSLEALRGEKMIKEISARHQLNPNQGVAWRDKPLAIRINSALCSKRLGGLTLGP